MSASEFEGGGGAQVKAIFSKQDPDFKTPSIKQMLNRILLFEKQICIVHECVRWQMKKKQNWTKS